MNMKGNKFIAIIDWKAETKKEFSWIPLDADNMLDAMNQANNLFDDNEENVYMMELAELVNPKSVDGKYGTDSRTWFWKPILESRSWNNWRTLDPDAKPAYTFLTYWVGAKIYSNYHFTRDFD